MQYWMIPQSHWIMLPSLLPRTDPETEQGLIQQMHLIGKRQLIPKKALGMEHQLI